MKTQKEIELTPSAGLRRSFTGPTAVASLALAAATIPVVAGDRSGTVTKEDSNAIRPFHVNVPKTELTELRRRINATKWPERETVTDQSQGVQLVTIQKLARYWATQYDWRKVEAKLNAVPQFMTEIDGLDIHCIHVRSEHENALPLIVTADYSDEEMHAALDNNMPNYASAIVTTAEVVDSISSIVSYKSAAAA
jgi:hypothetical protein